MTKIITKMKQNPFQNINTICKQHVLGLESYLEENLKDGSNCCENLLRGPVSGKWLSKYTTLSLYNLARDNRRFILKYLRDNSTNLV